jgi:hypothetical protein
MSRVSPGPRRTSRAQVRCCWPPSSSSPSSRRAGRGPVVGDGEAGDLRAAGQLGDGDVGVGAGADAELAGASHPHGKDAERAERGAGPDVQLLNLHDDLRNL